MNKLYLSPYVFDEKNGLTVLGNAPVLQVIRPSVLYWDSVTVPVPAPMLRPLVEQPLALLLSEGAVEVYAAQQRNVFDDSLNQALARDFLEKTSILLSQTEDKWSILCLGGGDQDALVRHFQAITGIQGGEKADRRRLLEISLRDALPVPPDNVAYQEILEFKARRSDELKSLNEAIDSLSVQLSGAEKPEDAVRVGKKTVEGALASIDRVMSEKWRSRLLSTLWANVGSVAAGVTAGVYATAELGLNTITGAALGGAALSGAAKPVIQAVFTSFLGQRRLPERAAPYVYAYNAGKELKPRN